MRMMRLTKYSPCSPVVPWGMPFVADRGESPAKRYGKGRGYVAQRRHKIRDPIWKEQQIDMDERVGVVG